MVEKNLSQLLAKITSTIKVYEKHAELSGENFNIFSIMGMESDEVRTHSAVIGELLNPKGSHSLGSKPLELFLNQISFLQNLILDCNSSICQKEVHIGKINEDKTEGGRIDLIVKDNAGVKLVIENKIYAAEQKNQLKRYKEKYPNAKVLYLTLDGLDSKGDFNEYDIISYQNHILNWIEACAKEAFDKPMVREVLNQYAYLIRKLTNQSTNVEMKDEIQKIIKDYYTESAEIYKNFVDVRNSFVEEAFCEIKNRGNLLGKWNIEFDRLNIWSSNTSQALLFSDIKDSTNFYYLRYEYSSSKLFLGIVPRTLKKNGKRSIQREEIRFLNDVDFVTEYLNLKMKAIDDVIKVIQNYIENNISTYSAHNINEKE